MIEGCNAEMRSHAQSPLGTWHIGMQSVDHFPIIYEDILCMLPCLRFQTCVGSRSTQSWVPPLCFCFCCRCYCHLSLLYPCLLMFMRLYLRAILVKSSVGFIDSERRRSAGMIPFYPINWNRPSSSG
jgi:hypothetical protein